MCSHRDSNSERCVRSAKVYPISLQEHLLAVHDGFEPSPLPAKMGAYYQVIRYSPIVKNNRTLFFFLKIEVCCCCLCPYQDTAEFPVTKLPQQGRQGLEPISFCLQVELFFGFAVCILIVLLTRIELVQYPGCKPGALNRLS